MDRRAAILRELPSLRRYARALTGDKEAADDLVQDCLERALDRLELWRHGESPRRWLFTIMHRLHLGELRRAARRPRHERLEDVTEGADGTLARPPSQAAHIHARQVLAALAELPIEQRQAVLLVGVEGMSYAEAAAVLDISVGTLMSRLSRGRKKLRELIGEPEDRPSRPSRLKVIK